MSQLTADKLLQDRRNGPQGRLLRGYLHKTSNSLCGIKGYASLIAGEADLETGAARWARRIISEVERLERIFRSVGDLTAPAAPRDWARDLSQVVAEAVGEAAAARPELRIEAGPMPEADLLLPAADLKLVLRELLANAAEGRDGRRGAALVTVAAVRQPTGHVALTVRDDGPGMARELAAQAADPFVTTKGEHAGIGLTRVETLMDMYGLAWHLGSAPGQGTSVTLEVAAAAGRTPA
ncbi:MAG: ATP-binding protein [Krumholzibacteria bacterium]|nr:ATP-binding protein [Candidatus Krumholzibacteria bacterium]